MDLDKKQGDSGFIHPSSEEDIHTAGAAKTDSAANADVLLHARQLMQSCDDFLQQCDDISALIVEAELMEREISQRKKCFPRLTNFFQRMKNLHFCQSSVTKRMAQNK
jgi:hypothetical protein